MLGLPPKEADTRPRELSLGANVFIRLPTALRYLIQTHTCVSRCTQSDIRLPACLSHSLWLGVPWNLWTASLSLQHSLHFSACGLLHLEGEGRTRAEAVWTGLQTTCLPGGSQETSRVPVNLGLEISPVYPEDSSGSLFMGVSSALALSSSLPFQ